MPRKQYIIRQRLGTIRVYIASKDSNWRFGVMSNRKIIWNDNVVPDYEDCRQVQLVCDNYFYFLQKADQETDAMQKKELIV